MQLAGTLYTKNSDEMVNNNFPVIERWYYRKVALFTYSNKLVKV